MTTGQTDRLTGLLGNPAIKNPCAVATTANIALTGEQTIDGVLTSASRVLVKNQTSSINNGIYVSDSGPWSRAVDFDGTRDVVEGTLIKVNAGSTMIGFWYVTTTGSPVPGTDAIAFGQASTVLAVVTAWAQNILASASAAAAWVFIKVGAIADANTWAGVQTFATTIFNGSATHNADITMTGASIIEAEGAAVTAASSTNIWATDGNTVHVTGNTGIADFATAPQAGAWMRVIFDGTPVLTQSTNLNLNAGGANVTIEAGDMAMVYADTTTQMDVFVVRKSGLPVVVTTPNLTPIASSLSGDVALNNTGSYFTGPTIAQGSTGTWFASGSVTLHNTGAAANMNVKLWDGTTVIASAQVVTPFANYCVVVSLSGYIATPAGNIRISVNDATSTAGVILYNQSGNGKDSTITAIRIA